MKRMMLVLLCLLLCSAPALAERGSATLPSTSDIGSVMDFYQLEGTLYLLTTQGVYRLLPEDTQPSLLLDLSLSNQYGVSSFAPENAVEHDLWEKAIGCIAPLNGKLVGLHPYTGQLCRIEAGEAHPLTQIPMDALASIPDPTFPDFVQYKTLLGLYGDNDTLYLALENYDSSGMRVVELWAWHESDQTMTQLPAEGLSAVYGLYDHQLLVSLSETQDVKLYNPQTQTFSDTLYSGAPDGCSGFAWNASENTLIYADGGTVKAAQPGQEAQVKAYLPITWAYDTDKAQLLADGSYAYLSGGSFYLRPLADASTLPTTLKLAGMQHDDWLSGFAMENPDIAPVTVDGISSLQLFQQELLSGSDEIDLFFISSGSMYASILEKGFYAKLSDSQVLTDLVAQYFPAIRDAVIKDGELAAFPLSISPNYWTINATKWEEFGLGDYPATMQELFALVKRWAEDYADEYPDYTLLETPMGLEGILSTVLEQYVLEHESATEPVNFDTPEFRSALEALESSRTYLSEENWNMPLIMTYAQYYGTGYNDSDLVTAYAPPAFSDTTPHMVGATLELCILNPNSKHKEEALRFIEYCAQHTQVEARYRLNETLTTPARGSGYEETQLRAEAKIAYLEDLLQNGAPENRADAQTLLDAEKQRYARREADSWSIAPESIQAYHDMMRYLTIPLHTIYSSQGGDSSQQVFDTLISRYAGGQLDIDRFIQQLNEKAMMIYTENN